MKAKYEMPDGEIVEREAIPQFKTPYNYDRDFESERTALYCPEPSLTKQEFKDETDINNIVERFMQTGDNSMVSLPEHFLDTTQRKTYFETATQLAKANETFYLLPANIRGQHLNDPARWADQVVQAATANDLDRLEKLGVDVEPDRAAAAAKAEAALQRQNAEKAAAAPKGPPEGSKKEPKSDNAEK